MDNSNPVSNAPQPTAPVVAPPTPATPAQPTAEVPATPVQSVPSPVTEVQPPAQPVAPAATSGVPAPVAVQKTILIVEDDPLLVKMYSTKFSKEGFNVMDAQDGEEGLKKATENNPDFMIVDVMMPKMSGIDMITKLRSDPAHKDIPIIVLTNLTQKEEAMKVQTLNVKEYLVKANFTPSEVVAKVKQYMGV